MRRFIIGALLGCIIYVLALFFATIRMTYAGECFHTCDHVKAQVEAWLIEEGVSKDYFYLMLVESRCTPGAVSEKGARGYWQLLPVTARRYGCDNPDDLECATRAAARYIKHLEGMFSEGMPAVIHAYNMGGHNFRKYGPTNQSRGLLWMVRRQMECRARERMEVK